MPRRVTLHQFLGRLRKLPEDLEDAVTKGLRSAAARGVGFVVEEIENAKPYPAVDRGELRSSARVEMVEGGARIEVDAPHAAIIEYGTRPFRPPVEPLAEWALRKGIADDEDEAMEIAWAIASKFAAEGIFPRGYFAKAMQRTFDIVAEEVAAELRRIGH